MTPERPSRRGIWRLVAAVLVALGLVLPLSTCTRGDPPVTENHDALGDVLQNPGCEGACRAGAFTLTLATLLWPLAASLAARRFRTRRAMLVRLCIEPLLLAATGWWLHWQIFLREPAMGFIAASAGLVLYAGVWFVELFAIFLERRSRLRAMDGTG